MDQLVYTATNGINLCTWFELHSIGCITPVLYLLYICLLVTVIYHVHSLTSPAPYMHVTYSPGHQYPQFKFNI